MGVESEAYNPVLNRQSAMETDHRVFVGDSRKLDEIDDNEIELVVTSPPYPMIEMWDDLFTDLDGEIGECLERGDGQSAFELMHDELDKVWAEVSRVLIDGGIACINIGDATRKVNDSFQMYPNHVEIIDTFRELGFHSLPDILWRKPANSAAKFMGSGMLPPNAYATLEHEHILIFRNSGKQRKFEPGSEHRYGSAYFWEERNDWFSDMWMDIRGTLQQLDNSDLRERSAAFPFELPHRLISMYSMYGDTVLDPFWGTGTTSIASMVAGRDSIGYEIEEEFTSIFDDRLDQIKQMSWDVTQNRIDRHREFVQQRLDDGNDLNYDAENYDFRVMTKQEKQIQFYSIEDINETGSGYQAVHAEFENDRQQSFSIQSQGQTQSKLGANFD